MEKYPNVNFDLTPGWEMYVGFTKRVDDWHDFFTKYSGRILYGTDSNSSKSNNPEIHQLVRLGISHDSSEFEMPIWKHTIRGLYLDDETRQKICYDNYMRFINMA